MGPTAFRPSTPTAPGTSTLSTAVAFGVDSVAPVVSLVAPVDGAVLSSATPVLSGGGGSAVGDDSTVSVDVFAGSAASGVPVQSLTAPVAAGAWSVSAAVLADGVYTARARQLDAAGNSGLSSAHTFTVDAGVPQVSIAQPSAGQVLSQGAVVVGGSASSASGDGPSVTVRVYAGSEASGSPVFTRHRADQLGCVAAHDAGAGRWVLQRSGRALRQRRARDALNGGRVRC